MGLYCINKILFDLICLKSAISSIAIDKYYLFTNNLYLVFTISHYMKGKPNKYKEELGISFILFSRQKNPRERIRSLS